jgi:hypothetical protein
MAEIHTLQAKNQEVPSVLPLLYPLIAAYKRKRRKAAQGKEL